MKDLLKVAIIMASLFASTFVLMQSTGLVTEAGVRHFLDGAYDIHPAWMAAFVIGLLMLDLLIAIPTMATILLAGYFMGPLLEGPFCCAFSRMMRGSKALKLLLRAMTCWSCSFAKRYLSCPN